MTDFKNEYRQAVDKLEPDKRLLDDLKSDMRAALEAPPKPGFFVRYRWVFASAAACLVLVIAVGVFLSLGGMRMEDMLYYGYSGGADGADIDISENAAAEKAEHTYHEDIMDGDSPDDSDAFLEPGAANEPENESFSTSTAKSDIFEADKNGDTAQVDESEGIYRILNNESERIEELKAVSYEELKALVTIQQEGGLILSDFLLLDYIEELGEEYYLLLRYDNNGASCPIAAAFSSSLSSESIALLRLYLSYDSSDRYIDLMDMTAEELENYLSA